MNIVLTGASGFIGQRLIEAITSNFPKSNLILVSSKPNKKFKTIIHNDYELSKDSFFSHKIYEIDVLVLLGAFIPKSNSEANDIYRSKKNIDSVTNILNVIPNVKKVIYISSIDVYPYNGDVVSEESLTIPQTLYGFSKLFSERIVETFCVNNNVLYQILRLGHIYGEGEEKYQKLIPSVIQSVLEKKNITIYNDGTAKVSFLYIQDCIENILAAISLDNFYGPINIVSGETFTVREVVEMIVTLSGKKNIEIINHNNNKKYNDYVFDNSKMVNYLARERHTLSNGLLAEIRYMESLKNAV